MNNQRKQQGAFLVLGWSILLLIGSYATPSTAEEAKAATEKVVSNSLLKELEAIIDELIKDGVATGRNMDGMTPEQLKEKLSEHFKPFITVSSVQEEKFQNGNFEDAINGEKMEAFIKQMYELKIDLPKPTQLFIKEFKQNQLKGARLEIAVRMNQMVIDKVRAALEKK